MKRMIGPLLALTFVAFISGKALADENVSPCADAIEQLETLSTELPVYKLLGGSRQFLDDADRQTEIVRLQKVVAACGRDPDTKAKLEAEAKRLHQARSPDCEFEREKLSLMEQSGRDSKHTIADQRKLVADKCPTVPTTDVWLLKIVGPHPPM